MTVVHMGGGRACYEYLPLEVALDSQLASPAARPNRQWALILALTLLVAALALCFDRARNGDLYLEIASGRFVSNHGLVSTDPFPTIAHGQPWLNQQWLSELAFFRVSNLVGLTGLSVLYALLLAAPLGLLLWTCRRKGAPMLVALAALYFPGALAIIHPRAAGFTLLLFSLLVAGLAYGWRHWRLEGGRRVWLAAAGIVGLFVLWANLHGGFLAGLLLIGLVCAGAAIDRLRRLTGSVPFARIALLGGVGVAALVAVSTATPLGDQIWTYMLSFRNSALTVASDEWSSAFQSPLAVIYLVAAAGFGAWVWLRTPRPRRATTLLVGIGFIAFGFASLRNTIFVGPVLALLVAWSAPNRETRFPRFPAAVAASAAVLAALVWVVFLGPARDDPRFDSPVIDYAIAHPPEKGRLVTYAGTGSYILWRSPHTPVVLNGWLEHFSAAELWGTYSLLRGYTPHIPHTLAQVQAGAVIAHVPAAIQRLEANGFVPRFTSAEGTYLVRPKNRPSRG